MGRTPPTSATTAQPELETTSTGALASASTIAGAIWGSLLPTSFLMLGLRWLGLATCDMHVGNGLVWRGSFGCCAPHRRQESRSCRRRSPYKHRVVLAMSQIG